MSDVFRNDIVALIPEMRRYAMGLTGSAAEADDLVQDALIRAWRFRESFRQGSYLKAWVFKILRNEFLNQLSSRRSAHHQMQDHVEDSQAYEGDQEWRIRYRELVVGLNKLPQLNREALLLVVGEGLTCDEAAHILGCAVGTVKSRISRAREALMRTLDLELEPAYPIARATARAEFA
jgi:RNA polymerase sigma-70 factor (ECF subfamily)